MAERRNDTQEANRLKEQLLALGVHPTTGQPLGEEEDEEAIRAEEEKIKEEKAEKKRKILLNQQAIAALKKRQEEDRIKKEKEWVFFALPHLFLLFFYHTRPKFGWQSRRAATAANPEPQLKPGQKRAPLVTLSMDDFWSVSWIGSGVKGWGSWKRKGAVAILPFNFFKSIM